MNPYCLVNLTLWFFCLKWLEETPDKKTIKSFVENNTDLNEVEYILEKFAFVVTPNKPSLYSLIDYISS